MDVDEILFCLLSIPVCLIEIRRSIKKYSSTTKDHGTLAYIWIVIPCSIGLTKYLMRLGYGGKILEKSWMKYSIYMPMCTIVCVLGCVLRQRAIDELGQWFTTSICTNDNQKIIDSGWYGRMRHPSYTGTLMNFLGITLALNNWLGLIGIFVPVYCVFRYRVYIEEKELEKHFDKQYRTYRTRVTNMFIPK